MAALGIHDEALLDELTLSIDTASPEEFAGIFAAWRRHEQDAADIRAIRQWHDVRTGRVESDSLLYDFGQAPAMHSNAMQEELAKDVELIRYPSVVKGLRVVADDPALKLKWDVFLRHKHVPTREFWESVRASEGRAGGRVTPLLTAKDFLLDDEEDIDWLMEGLVATGTLSLLAGPPKAGKSTLARHLVTSILAGTAFLGRAVRPGRVLLYSLEDPHKVSGLHFAQLGLQPDMPLWGRITHEEGPFLETLVADLKEATPDLVLIDTMNVALDWDDMNSMEETTKKLTPLRELTRATNAAIILLAHTRKTSTGSGLDILGSTGIRAATDVNMILHHDEETDIRSLKTEGKLGDHFKHTPIALENGRCTLGKYSHLSSIDSAMLQTLTVEPGHTLSHNQWLKACKVGTREKRAEAITRLQREGLVISERGEKNAMFYTVFSPDMG